MLAINIVDGGVVVVDLDIQPKGGLGVYNVALVFGPLYDGSLQSRVDSCREFIINKEG